MWTKNTNGTYVEEVSNLGCLPGGQPGVKCPVCARCVLASSHVGTDYADVNREDVAGWRYTHPCGAKLLIIND